MVLASGNRFQNKAQTGNIELLVMDLVLFLFAEFEFQDMNSQFQAGSFELEMNQ